MCVLTIKIPVMPVITVCNSVHVRVYMGCCIGVLSLILLL